MAAVVSKYRASDALTISAFIKKFTLMQQCAGS
jgi:hypothetical protein